MELQDSNKMNIHRLSPYIRVALDSYIEPDKKITPRVIFDYELLYVKAGNAEIIIEETSYDVKPGDIYLFRPGQTHSIRTYGSISFHQPHIHFDLHYREDAHEVRVSFKPMEAMSESEHKLFRDMGEETTASHLPGKLFVRNSAVFEEMLFKIIKEYNSKLPFSDIRTKALFLELWTFILRENANLTNPYNSKIEDMKVVEEFIRANAEKELTLIILEKEFKTSRFHLVRVFKSTYGVSPMHLHNLLRIEKARELVQYSSKSLTEIAEQLGYSSINAFSRSFKKIDGVSPSFYRRTSKPTSVK